MKVGIDLYLIAPDDDLGVILSRCPVIEGHLLIKTLNFIRNAFFHKDMFILPHRVYIVRRFIAARFYRFSDLQQDVDYQTGEG